MSKSSWEILEDAYAGLMERTNTPDETPVNPDDPSDWDYTEAASETAYQILTSERFPEVALLEALAQNGYLDGHRIWEEITEAIGDGLRAFTEERWEERAGEEEDWEE